MQNLRSSQQQMLKVRMEAARSLKMSVPYHKTVWHHNPEDLNLSISSWQRDSFLTLLSSSLLHIIYTGGDSYYIKSVRCNL
jgi:hypothetical protein